MSTTKSIRQMLQDVFSFPHPVNEVAARLVAAMVVILTSVIILSNTYWLLFVLAYGFLARVLTGPTLSPIGLLATRVLVPILGNPAKLVAGPPNGLLKWWDSVFRRQLSSWCMDLA